MSNFYSRIMNQENYEDISDRDNHVTPQETLNIYMNMLHIEEIDEMEQTEQTEEKQDNSIISNIKDKMEEMKNINDLTIFDLQKIKSGRSWYEHKCLYCFDICPTYTINKNNEICSKCYDNVKSKIWKCNMCNSIHDLLYKNDTLICELCSCIKYSLPKEIKDKENYEDRELIEIQRDISECNITMEVRDSYVISNYMKRRINRNLNRIKTIYNGLNWSSFNQLITYSISGQQKYKYMLTKQIDYEFQPIINRVYFSNNIIRVSIKYPVKIEYDYIENTRNIKISNNLIISYDYIHNYIINKMNGKKLDYEIISEVESNKLNQTPEQRLKNDDKKYKIYKYEAKRLRIISFKKIIDNVIIDDNIIIMGWNYTDTIKKYFSKGQLKKYETMATYDPRRQPYGILTKNKKKIRIIFNSKRHKQNINDFRINEYEKILITTFYNVDDNVNIHTMSEIIFVRDNIMINIKRKIHMIKVLIMIKNRGNNGLYYLPMEIFNIICEYYMGCIKKEFNLKCMATAGLKSLSWKD